MAETQLTKETYERLKKELEELTTKGRVEAARAIEAARALGDLSENGDYHAAKDAKGKLEARIKHIEKLLKDATVVETESRQTNTVTVGVTVELRFEGDSETESYFVGSIEESVNGVTVVSPTSPLGKALLDKKVGDEVVYQAPSGDLKATVVSIK